MSGFRPAPTTNIWKRVRDNVQRDSTAEIIRHDTHHWQACLSQHSTAPHRRERDQERALRAPTPSLSTQCPPWTRYRGSLHGERDSHCARSSTPQRPSWKKGRTPPHRMIRERKAFPPEQPTRATIYLSPFSRRGPCVRLSISGRRRRSGRCRTVAHSLWLVPRSASKASVRPGGPLAHALAGTPDLIRRVCD